MIRLPAALLAAGLLWAVASLASAEDPKPAAPAAGVSPQTQKINELIAKGWESAGVKKPAEKASDNEFMRRAFIDLVGRIPTAEEIVDFEMDKAANKRAKLINRLLNDNFYRPKDKTGKYLEGIPGLRMASPGDIGREEKKEKGKLERGLNYNEAFAQNLAELWTTWLLTRSNTNPAYRQSLHSWLSIALMNDPDGSGKIGGFMMVMEGGKAKKLNYAHGAPWNDIVFHLISDTGKSNEVGSVVFVIRHLGEPIAVEMGQKPDFAKDGKFDAVPITSRVTKMFLGIQSQCTQCHDHPFNKEYVQSDFWGVNAFFRQTERSGTTNPRNLAMGVSPPPLTLADESTWNHGGMVLYERRDGQRKASFPVMIKNLEQAAKGEPSSKRLVSGSIPNDLVGKTRRQILAQWVTEHDNFGRAFVNRMWGHLFGRGLNKEPTVDDFSSNNEVVHPELLDYLAEEFKKYQYDPKKLLEWICTSDVYQLSHVANTAYTDQKFDPYFARMPLKALSPEVMFESLAVATRIETRKDEKGYRALKDAWTAKLTQNFGDDEGNEITFNGTVVQALLMMNGKEINGEIGSGKGVRDAKEGVVEDVVRKYLPSGGARAVLDHLFLMTVSRHITAKEYSQLEGVMHGAAVNLGSNPPPKTGGKPSPKGPAPAGPNVVMIPGTGPTDLSFYQDVFWALLNSNEFMLNH